MRSKLDLNLNGRILVLGLLLIVCLSQVEGKEFPFVLNHANTSYEHMHVSAWYSYNNLPNIFMLFYRSEYWEPTIVHDRSFAAYAIRLRVKRIGLELFQYEKFQPYHTHSVWHDSLRVRYWDIRHVRLEWLAVPWKYGDVTISVNRIDLESLALYFAFFVSKSFDRFAYSVGVEAPSVSYAWFLPSPAVPFLSVAYKPLKNITIFTEGKYIAIVVDGDRYTHGRTAVLGVNYTLLDCVDIAAFRYYSYNESEEPFPYLREDIRTGISVRLSFGE